MNDLASKWIADRSALPGMIGCGVSEPGGNCLCQSANELICPSGKLEQIIHQIVGAKTRLAADGVSPLWQTWVFAHGKIRSATRPDGWIMVAVVNEEPAGAKTLDTLTTEFLALAPGN